MPDPTDFLAALRHADIEYFVGVPDSLMKSFCACVAERIPETRHTICANEGAAIGMAIGHHLATGRVPAVYMQNSGLGNAANPLLSLASPEVYSIPMVLIIGWRGQPGTRDEPQHMKQGKVTLGMLEAMEVPALVLDDEVIEGRRFAERLRDRLGRLQSPLALVVPKGFFSGYEQARKTSKYALTREQAIAQITAALDYRDLVVSTTGMTSRELYEIRETRSEGHGRDFMLVGGMGHAGAVALGMAQARPGRRVVCLDGDGSVLMHMGSLAIAGQSGCRHLKHIVLNNGAHDSVGGQPTVALRVDLCAVARAVGFQHVARCSRAEDLDREIAAFLAADSLAFLEVRVRQGHRPDLGRPESEPLVNKRNFMDSVGG